MKKLIIFLGAITIYMCSDSSFACAQAQNFSGNTNVCSSSGGTYGYQLDISCQYPATWTLSGGGTIQSSGVGSPYNYSYVSVAWNASGTWTLTATQSVACSPSAQYQLNITVSILPGTPTISSNSSHSEICTGESWVLTSNLSGYPTNYGYDWYASGGVLINGLNSSSSTPIHTSSNSVTITPASANGTCNIFSRLNNGNSCPSNYASFSFQVGPPVANISTLIYPSGQRGINPVTLSLLSTYNFQCDPITGATSFNWVLPSGFSFL